jgi:RNA polymerase-interacting CarD/CdnL/TRCF family regulator
VAVMKKHEEILRKLERVYALYQRTGSAGEKEAAARAVQRLQRRLANLQKYDEPEIQEYKHQIFVKK